MQAADIFELDIDLAIGGMDQEEAHMYMRDVADKVELAESNVFAYFNSLKFTFKKSKNGIF